MINLKEVVLGFSLWTSPSRVTIKIEAIEQYFHVVLFTLLYNVVLTFKSSV